MSVADPLPPVATGRLDSRGRLLDAEPRLLSLNARAGGRLGAPLAVPPIAAVARLAQRLGISVARTAVAADGDDDLDLWVRAAPEPGGVRIEVSGWSPRAAWTAADQSREADFLRTAADWMWETDAALRITFLAADAGPRYGVDTADMLGQPLTRLLRLIEDDQGNLPILIAIAAQSGFEAQKAEVRGTGRMVEIAATPRIDPAGRFAGYVGGAHALDDDSSAAREPMVSLSPASFGGFPDSFSQRLDRALRDPLGQIIANADSIRAQSEGPISADYAEYAGDIASAGRHLLGLVDDLVDLQAIERADFAPKREAIDLADIARRAAALLAVRASQSNVSIDRPDSEEMLRVTGETRRSLQVLVNLIGNAVRYSPPGGTVRIRVEREGDMGCVIVADEGKGIAPEDHERIFGKFSRLDPDEAGGSGLGLYIARRLARAMGGELVVDSATGMGARFVFMLPCRD